MTSSTPTLTTNFQTLLPSKPDVSSEKTQQEFIRTVWQQKALFIEAAVADLNGMIDGDTLADLACEPEVESRIIFGHGIDDGWSCQHGPFDEASFAQLPDKNWTLLVQGLDQWSEELNSVLDRFHFLPRWRLEDIMASYAPLGGGVGPHFDYYDVFLLQISGEREWQLGERCDENTPLQNNEQVKLLEQFTVQQQYAAKAGDVLYIPAGLAHWGTAASDDCITLSVGFRAPSQREILLTALNNLADGFSEQQRYQDTVNSIDHHPSKINQAVHQQLSQYLHALTPELLQESINQAFGQLVTEPRYTAVEEDNDERDYVKIIIQQLKQDQYIELQHPIHSRLAFSDQQLFVNGEAYTVSEAFAKGVCSGKLEGELSDHEIVFLIELLERGDVELM